MNRGARVLEVIDPGADPGNVDGPPVVLPHRIYLDGIEAPDGTRFMEVDFGRQWPLTVTLAVPQDELRYTVTRTDSTGEPLGGRVWIGDTEVHTPNDPIMYPDPGSPTAIVDVHVQELRFGAPRHQILD